MVTQRSDETNPGVCPPLPLIGLRLGRSLKRLGADRRHPHDVVPSRLRQASRVTICVVKIRLAHLAVLSTAKPVSVPREPSVEQINERPHQWNLEHPRDRSSLRQNLQQFLERRRCLPRLSISRPHNLHGLHVSPPRDPRKPLPNPRRLRRDNLELMVPIPLGQHPHHPPAHLAVTVIDHCVTPVRLTNGWRI